jgi:hypothetical protein
LDRREGPTISDIFSILEKNKETLHIESYLLSQTTLEQIFMSFANKSSRANSFHNKKESFKRNIQPDLFSKYSFDTCESDEKNKNDFPVLLSVSKLTARTDLFKTQTLKKIKKIKNKIKQIEEYQF